MTWRVLDRLVTVALWGMLITAALSPALAFALAIYLLTHLR